MTTAEQTVLPDQIVQVESTSPRDADAEAGTPQLDIDGDVEEEQASDNREGKKDREPGKSVLPFSRVQKIIKADKELPMIAKDATFLISLATEEFIKKLSQACQRLAEREGRTTVQQKDIAHTVRRVEEFLFLEEIIGSQEATGKRKPLKTKANVMPDEDESQPTLRNFIRTADPSEEDGEARNVVTNEDGIMYTE